MTEDIKSILEKQGITDLSQITEDQRAGLFNALLAENAELSAITDANITDLYRQADQLETKIAVARALRSVA